MRILSKKEIERITGMVRGTNQVEVLRLMKIDYRVNPNGDIIVIDADLPLKNRIAEPTISLNLDAA